MKAVDIPDHLQINRNNSDSSTGSSSQQQGSTPSATNGNDSFTDGGIAVQNSRMNQRKLVSAEESGWLTDGQNGNNGGMFETLGDNSHNYADNMLNQARSAKGWDQFTINREKFGVQSTYDETLYTTALNEAEFTDEQKQEAIRLAREIENNTGTTNIHVLEERGLTATLSGNNNWADMMMDEETMHSAVIRGPNPVVPPTGGSTTSNNVSTYRTTTASVSYVKMVRGNDLSSSTSNANSSVPSASSNVASLTSSGKGNAYVPPNRRTVLPNGPTVNTTPDGTAPNSNGQSPQIPTTLPSSSANGSVNLAASRTSPRLTSPTSSAIRSRNIPNVQPLNYEQKDQFIAESQKFSAKIGSPKSAASKDNATNESMATNVADSSTASDAGLPVTTNNSENDNERSTLKTTATTTQDNITHTETTTEPVKSSSSLVSSLKKSGLNAGAKEFVPTFSTSSTASSNTANVPVSSSPDTTNMQPVPSMGNPPTMIPMMNPNVQGVPFVHPNGPMQLFMGQHYPPFNNGNLPPGAYSISKPFPPMGGIGIPGGMDPNNNNVPHSSIVYVQNPGNPNPSPFMIQSPTGGQQVFLMPQNPSIGGFNPINPTPVPQFLPPNIIIPGGNPPPNGLIGPNSFQLPPGQTFIQHPGPGMFMQGPAIGPGQPGPTTTVINVSTTTTNSNAETSSNGGASDYNNNGSNGGQILTANTGTINPSNNNNNNSSNNNPNNNNNVGNRYTNNPINNGPNLYSPGGGGGTPPSQNFQRNTFTNRGGRGGGRGGY